MTFEIFFVTPYARFTDQQMPISKLPSSTSALIRSAQYIPSYEDAVLSVVQNALTFGAHHVDVTVNPSDLCFTVSDDGPGIRRADWHLMLQPACTSQIGCRGQSLAALAAVASVWLYTRCDDFYAAKHVQAGNLLKCSLRHPLVSPTPHNSLQNHNGLVVKVGDMFADIPVRRRVELEKGAIHTLQTLCQRIVALSLANPNVGITLSTHNGISYYKSIPREQLTVDMIQIAFGDSHGLDWQPVQALTPDNFQMVGFISSKGSTNGAIQYVSVNKIPLERNAWVHSHMRKIWTTHLLRDSNHASESNKMPAYVLNCSGSAAAAAACNRSEKPPQTMPFLRLLQSAVQDALYTASPEHRSSQKDIRSIANTKLRVTDAVVNTVRKRFMPGRFSDATICKPIHKPPPSLWSSKAACEILKRPLSREHATATTNVKNRRQLVKSTRVVNHRPLSAEAVEYSYRKLFPHWSNPCFARDLCSSRNSFMESKKRPQMNGRAERCRTAIQRDTIKQLRIVGQVDKKFIVAVDQTAVMYVIDQHAASERFMYETLMQNIRTRVFPSTLQTPQRVVLSRLQMETASRIWYNLQQWGWTLRTGTDGTDIDMIQVPRIDGTDVILNGGRHLQRYLDDVRSGALGQAIPKPIVESIATAACHSAVRFGDELTREQCESLVWSMADCSNPFICAHGRPSIVPLVRLDYIHA